jgi:hypothetical protein
MSETDELTLQMLRKIDRKLSVLIKALGSERMDDSVHKKLATEPASLRRRADEIAALTPRDIPQSDSADLLREDRLR